MDWIGWRRDRGWVVMAGIGHGLAGILVVLVVVGWIGEHTVGKFGGGWIGLVLWISWVCASLAWQWRFSCVVLFLFVPWCFRLDCVAFGLWMYSFPGYLVVFRPSSASGFGVSSGAFSCVPLLVPGCTYFPGWCFAWQALDSLGLGGLVLVGVE